MQYIPLYSQEQVRRHDVKPGLSGLAQINGRNSLSWEKKFFFDVLYVKKISLWVDLHVLWVTIWKVIRKEGISADNDATMPPFQGSEK